MSIKENIVFSRNGNIRKFWKTLSLLTMKISVYMVFSYTENVITRRNYHLFKSFLIQENEKWHFFYTKTYEETYFSGTCNNA